jgi:inorganic triphosphatase YgiF
LSTETELKLLLAPEQLRRLPRNALVRRLKRGRGVSDTLKSVYFDTDDMQLRDNRMVLRVRHIGRRRIQTLKTMGEPNAGISHRQEWETEITGDVPEALPLRATEIRLPQPEDRLVRSLHPIFSTEVKRTTYTLGADGWEVEMALDEGRVVGPVGSTPICEAEFELKRGEPRILFDLARSLQQHSFGRVSITTKAERGFALLGDEPSPRRARAPVFPPDASIGQAFQSIVRVCAEQLLANQDVLFATGNPEAVHQMRVALRRLNSGIRLFADFTETPETQALREEIRWLQGFLGPARDAEVFVSDILDPLAAEMGEQPGYQALAHDFAERRMTTLEAAQKALAEPRFTQLALALGGWIEGGDWQGADEPAARERLATPARAFAAAVLDRRDRRVRRALRQLGELDAEGRHRARIRVKRLRYAIEFFAGLFPDRKARRLVATLGRLQDRLGQLNDIAVAARLLREHAEANGDPSRMWAAGQIAGWHAGRVGGLLAAAEDGRQALARQTRFWRDGD